MFQRFSHAFDLLRTLLLSDAPAPDRGYKAPHAKGGTPPRPRFSRKGRKRLFKGHRP